MGKPAAEFGFPVGFFVTRQGRHVGQGFIQTWIECFAQLGQDVVTHSVARIRKVAICFVSAPGDRTLAQPAFDFGPIGFEQRTNKSFFCYRQDSRKAGQTGASENSIENGLSLIASRVSRCDSMNGSRRHQLSKKCAANIARHFFQIAGHCGKIRFQDMETQSELFGQVSHKLSIVVGCLASDAVIDVNHTQIRHLAEGMQQENRVGATRDSYTDPASRAKHLVTRDELSNPIEHSISRIISRASAQIYPCTRWERHGRESRSR